MCQMQSMFKNWEFMGLLSFKQSSHLISCTVNSNNDMCKVYLHWVLSIVTNKSIYMIYNVHYI